MTAALTSTFLAILICGQTGPEDSRIDAMTRNINALRIDQVESLLNGGLNPNLLTRDGNTFLQIVASRGIQQLFIPPPRLSHQYAEQDAQIIALLIRYGADPNSIGNKHYYDPPLLLAAQRGDVAVAKALIDGGAGANARNDKGQTALGYSIAAGIYKELEPSKWVEAKASLTSRRPRLRTRYAVTRNLDGSFSYYKLVEGDRPEMLEYLLSAGADPNAPAEKDMPPLQLAAYLGRAEYVRILLDHGANIDAQVKESDYIERVMGFSLEDSRITPAQREKLQALMGANGYTALHAACLENLEENGAVVRLLISRGANSNLRDNLGRKAWDITVQKGHTIIQKAFTEAMQERRGGRQSSIPPSAQ